MRLTSLGERANRGTHFWTDIALLPGVLSILVLFTAIFFHAITARGLSDNVDSWQCAADGSVMFPWQTYSPIWDTSQYLSITLGFGNFGFGLAKGIDVAWDLVVGRGGQLLVTLVTYSVLRRSFLHSLEKRTASFRMFAAMAFDRVSTGSLLTLGANIATRKRKAWRGWTTIQLEWRYLLFVIAFLYVLSFPTWLSVMTGYQAKMVVYFSDHNDNLVLAESLVRSWGTIQDGSRLGLWDGYPVSDVSVAVTWNLYVDRLSAIVLDTGEGFYANRTTVSAQCDSGGDSGGSSAHHWCILVPPHYNFSDPLYNVADPKDIPNPIDPVQITPGTASLDLATNHTINGTRHSLPTPPISYIAQELYVLDNTTFDAWYLETYTSCEPAAVYRWGFSSLLLFTFLIFTMIFVVVLMVLHYETYWYGRGDAYRQPVNVFRDMLDLAKELRTQLSHDVEDMPADELKATIKKDEGVVRLERDQLPLSRADQWRAGKRTGYSNANPLAMLRNLRRPSSAMQKSGSTYHTILEDEHAIQADGLELRTVVVETK